MTMVEASPWLQTNWPQGPSPYGPSRQRLTFLIAWTWDLGDLSIDNEHIWNIYGTYMENWLVVLEPWNGL